MNLETRQAYSEVNKFLELIEEYLSNKIPLGLRKYFRREMDNTYIPNINANIPINQQNLKRKTIAIIAGLNLRYWCKDEKRKTQLSDTYLNNEKVHQQELRKKYDPNKVFKPYDPNRVYRKYMQEDANKKDVSIIKNKDSLFEKIIIKIKDVFKIKNIEELHFLVISTGILFRAALVK